MTKEKTKKTTMKRCFVIWRDAAYCFTKNLPRYSPPLEITDGFIVKETEDYLNVAVNVRYGPNTGNYWPVDGFVIPKKAIVKIRRSEVKI